MDNQALGTAVTPKKVEQTMDIADGMNAPTEVVNWIGRHLFEHVPSNIVVIDRKFRVVLANAQFKEVFGDPEGKYCYEVYKKQDKVCEQCMAVCTFRDGKVRINDEEGLDRQGRPAHYIVHIAPVYNEVGEVTHIIEMSYDVTETKSLQREYNILFERVPCYVAVINRKLQIVRANELLRQMFGDTSGQHCYQVLKHRAERCTNCPAMKTFSDGKVYRSEEVGVNKNGESTYYVASTAPLSRSGEKFSHVIEMSMDVTDVHKLTGNLSQELAVRQLLTESSPDALVAVDCAGLVNIFNPAAGKLFGISPSQVIGTPEAGRFLPGAFRRLLEKGGTSLSIPETTVEDFKGMKIPVRFYGAVLRDGEKVVGEAGYLQDIREIKQLEKEKLENERLASVGQTVAQLAHGIKNILTGLQGGIYIIGSGIDKDARERTNRGLNMLRRNIERITTLVKGFLDFSRKRSPKLKPTDPNELGREIYELYREAAKQKGIDLFLEVKKETAAADIDPEDIHTCLANLVSNAIDACQISGKAACTVTLRVDETEDSLIFEVLDTGCGMDGEIQGKVFTNFFTTKGLGGNGLGLLVTNKIVKEHGGRIKVDSKEGQGSAFRIELPREKLPVEPKST